VEWLEVVFAAAVLGGIAVALWETFIRRRIRRRTVYYLLLFFAAVATPTPDAIGMIWIWVPSVVLFEAGYFIYRRRNGETAPNAASEESGSR
jgi:Sec-independent protein secretion pathway component TatC